MPTQHTSNSRILKNTFILYGRMFLLMLIGLYASRIVLAALGVEDYGIYNAVGGMVVMFTLLTDSISAAISRFVTFELGKENNRTRLREVFATSVAIMIGLSVLLLVVGESLGLWFLNNKLNIPEARYDAANYVFQFSLASLFLTLITVPYKSTIVAHEKMSIYAYLGIFDGVSKLLIALLICISPIDRLIFYALLFFLISVVNFVVHIWYCRKKFEECIFKFVYRKDILKEMFGFSVWSFIGTGGAILMSQGVNMLFNIYFNVTVNAARGIAVQVEGAIQSFVNNFSTAMRPQIIKSYAAQETDDMFRVVFMGARFAFFLCFFFTLPIVLETPTVLRIWLGFIPNYSVLFIRWALIITLLFSLSDTMITAMNAYGKIRNYQLIVGTLSICVFLFSIIAYELGAPVETAYLIQFSIFILQLILRLVLTHKMIGLSVTTFIKKVLCRVFLVGITASIFPIIIHYAMDATVVRFLTVGVVSVLCTVTSIYILGLEPTERTMIQQKAKDFYYKLKSSTVCHN